MRWSASYDPEHDQIVLSMPAGDAYVLEHDEAMLLQLDLRKAWGSSVQAIRARGPESLSDRL